MSLSGVKIVAVFRKEVQSVCRGLLLNLGGCLLGCSLYYCGMWNKMESLKLRALKWSQEAIKGMSLMHILTRQNTNFWTRQNHTYSRILQKQVQLVTETYFLFNDSPSYRLCSTKISFLPTALVQVLCEWFRQTSPFAFKNLWFCSPVGTTWISMHSLQFFLIPNNHFSFSLLGFCLLTI